MLLFTGQCSKCSKNIMQLVRPCISMETHSQVEYNVPNWRSEEPFTLSYTVITHWACSVDCLIFHQDYDCHKIDSAATQIDIKPEITARYIKLHPKDRYNHYYLALELLGCVASQPALGMQSKAIADSQISATSTEDTCHPKLARAGLEPPDRADCKLWCASVNDTEPALTIDMTWLYHITGVGIQGQNGVRRIKSFNLSYSVDGKTWSRYDKHVSWYTFDIRFLNCIDEIDHWL